MARRTRSTAPLPIFGIDVSKPGEHVAARATKYCRDVNVSRSVISKRYGTESCGAGMGERVMHLAELVRRTGITHFVRIGPTKFEELNKSTDIWTSKASTALAATDDDPISVAFPILSGDRILVYTNGVDDIRKFTGSGNDADLGGSPPLARFLLDYRSYLLIMNLTDSGDRFPWRIEWCDTADPENWSTGNAGSIDLLEDSDDITGCGYHGSNFTVHKENSIYIGYLTNSQSVFVFERRETGVGSIAHNSIVALPTGDQIFLARDGFHLFNGISSPVIDSLVNDELRETINPATAHKSWARLVKERDEVHMGVPVGSNENPLEIYKYNYLTRQMYKDVRVNCTFMSMYKNTTGQLTWDELPSTWDAWSGQWDNVSLASLNNVYTFGFSNGVVTRQNTGSIESAGVGVDFAIYSLWESKDFTSLDFEEVGIPDLLMRWQEIRLWAKGSGSLIVDYTTDGGESWQSAGSVTLDWEYPGDNSPLRLYVDLKSVRFGIRIIHSDENETFEFKQFAITAVPGEESGR